MVYDKANELAKLLKESDEFREYKTTKEKAFENDTTASLIKEYHKLQLAAQAAMVSGKKDDETMQRLQKIGELLQLNQDASAFLFAEYRLNRVVSDIYKIATIKANSPICASPMPICTAVFTVSPVINAPRKQFSALPAMTSMETSKIQCPFCRQIAGLTNSPMETKNTAAKSVRRGSVIVLSLWRCGELEDNTPTRNAPSASEKSSL